MKQLDLFDRPVEPAVTFDLGGHYTRQGGIRCIGEARLYYNGKLAMQGFARKMV